MATNSFGLDAAYFSDKLSLVLRDLGHFTPEELARTLARMARTACEGVLGEAEFAVQAAPTCAAQDGDAQLDAMRRSGLSIDGDNAYKRDLIDCIVGALMLGKQGVNPPPAGHWLEQFWQMARGEGEIQEQLAATPAAPVAQKPVRELIGYACDRRGALIPDRCGECLCWPAYQDAPPATEQPDTVAVPRELLGEAESIIESYAEALKASHAPGGDWEDEEAAHDEYELEEGVASKLRALLRGGEA